MRVDDTGHLAPSRGDAAVTHHPERVLGEPLRRPRSRTTNEPRAGVLTSHPSSSTFSNRLLNRHRTISQRHAGCNRPSGRASWSGSDCRRSPRRVPWPAGQFHQAWSPLTAPMDRSIAGPPGTAPA